MAWLLARAARMGLRWRLDREEQDFEGILEARQWPNSENSHPAPESRPSCGQLATLLRPDGAGLR